MMTREFFALLSSAFPTRIQNLVNGHGPTANLTRQSAMIAFRPFTAAGGEPVGRSGSQAAFDVKWLSLSLQ